jgi:4-amino-4-deoxy-L-arabinose transferase-like glycosyltransferase
MQIGKSKLDLLATAILLALSSIAFVNLLGLPAFEDEGVAMRQVWRVIEAGEWLFPLQYGKPLEVWPVAPLVWLGLPPLKTMRWLHVFAGMIGTVLTYWTAREVGNRHSAFIAGVLFAVCPFVMYLQRMTLSEIYLCVAGLWVLLSVIKFLERQTWPRTVSLANSLVLAAFAKSPVGFVFLIALPLALLFLPQAERRRLMRPPARARLLIACGPSVLLALAAMVVGLVQLQRGQDPDFGLAWVLEMGSSTYDVATMLGVPPVNLLDELAAQLSMPVVICGVIGIMAAVIRGNWPARWLTAMGALPMLGIGLLSKNWFSRYLLFTLPPLIISTVSGWQWLLLRLGKLKPLATAAVLSTCVGMLGYQSALIILDPPAARWSALDRFQYITGWPSGYGFPEAAQFLMSAPDVPPMIYALDGHSAFRLRSCLPPGWVDRVRPIDFALDGRWLSTEQERLDFLVGQTPTWIIVSEQLLDIYLESDFGEPNPSAISLRRIALFNKPESRVQLAIYEVTRARVPTEQ